MREQWNYRCVNGIDNFYLPKIRKDTDYRPISRAITAGSSPGFRTCPFQDRSGQSSGLRADPERGLVWFCSSGSSIDFLSSVLRCHGKQVPQLGVVTIDIFHCWSLTSGGEVFDHRSIHIKFSGLSGLSIQYAQSRFRT